MAQAAPVVPAALAGRFIVAYSAPIRLACLVATAVATAAPLIELAVVLVSITGKATVGCGPMWSDQASSIALAAIAFIGGAAAYPGAHHTSLRFITDRLTRTGRLGVGVALPWSLKVAKAA